MRTWSLLVLVAACNTTEHTEPDAAPDVDADLRTFATTYVRVRATVTYNGGAPMVCDQGFQGLGAQDTTDGRMLQLTSCIADKPQPWSYEFTLDLRRGDLSVHPLAFKARYSLCPGTGDLMVQLTDKESGLYETVRYTTVGYCVAP